MTKGKIMEEVKSEKKETKMQLDENQSRAVDTFENVVVSAGAGSGKTRVLAERFLRLIEGKRDKESTDVDRILTLTFTNKAAVEMKERIFKTLSKKSAESPLALAAVKNFDKAHIQTLDSYFSDIAKQGAHYYGITPAFSLDEDGIKAKIKTHALEFILSRSKENEALKKMTKIFTIDALAETMFAYAIVKLTSVVDSIDFVSDLEKQKAKIAELWKKNTKISDSAIGKMKEALSKEEKKTSTLSTFDNFFETNALPTGSEITFDTNNVSALSEYALYLSNLISCVERAPSGKKGASGEVSEAYKALYEPYSILAECINFASSYETAKEIASLLNDFEKEANEIKRTSGTLTFRDISRLAFHTLKEHDDIRHTEQKKFDKIMIDEFQDNDQMQCDVLFMLADENERFDESGYIIPNFEKESDNYIQKRLGKEKLFFVGDEKQSIYRFRNADVSVFRNLQEHLGLRLELDTNYRSKPELIFAFNAIFGGTEHNQGVFPSESNRAHTQSYEAVYQTVKIPESKMSDFDAAKKRVEIDLYKSEEKKDDSEKEAPNKRNCQAAFIAKKIKQLVSEEGYKYSDIALLFRKSTNLSAYEKELLHAKIPYSTEVYNGFYSDGPINDLVSYLKICAYPDDVNALVKVLRSSFVNLSLESARALASKIKETLYEQKSENVESDTFAPFDEKAKNAAKEILGEGTSEYKRFLIAQKNFSEIKNALKTKSISAIISILWNDFGYRYETMWNADVSMYAPMYDILLELARKAEQNTQNLASFIDEVETYKDNTEKIDNLNVPMESSDSVKILTIHKSKGLEFKVVFVCDISASPKAFATPPVILSKQYGAVLKMPPSDFFERCKTKDGMEIHKKANANYFAIEEEMRAEKEDEAELKRIAYVAFTRAEERLFVVGEKKDAPKGTMKTIFHIISPLVDAKENGEDLPFDLEFFDSEIAKKDENKAENNEILNTKEAKNEFAKQKASIYESAKEEPSEIILPLHMSPSSLETSEEEKESAKEVPFSEIDEIVKKSIPRREVGASSEKEKKRRPRFGYNDFGSIAHKTLEKRFNTKDDIHIEQKLYDGIDDDKDVKKVNEICEKMADTFEKSALFSQCKKAAEGEERELYSEFGFRSTLEAECADGKKHAVVIRGSIDLIFKNEDDSAFKYTIVDYKTDRAVKKEKYLPQLSCYRAAAADIFGVKEEEIRCVLYFLRYGQEIDVSQECSKEKASAELSRVLASISKNDL